MNQYDVIKPLRFGYTDYKPGDVISLKPDDAAMYVNLRLIKPVGA